MFSVIKFPSITDVRLSRYELVALHLIYFIHCISYVTFHALLFIFLSSSSFLLISCHLISRIFMRCHYFKSSFINFNKSWLVKCHFLHLIKLLKTDRVFSESPICKINNFIWWTLIFIVTSSLIPFLLFAVYLSSNCMPFSVYILITM